MTGLAAREEGEGGVWMEGEKQECGGERKHVSKGVAE